MMHGLKFLKFLKSLIQLQTYLALWVFHFHFQSIHLEMWRILGQEVTHQASRKLFTRHFLPQLRKTHDTIATGFEPTARCYRCVNNCCWVSLNTKFVSQHKKIHIIVMGKNLRFTDVSQLKINMANINMDLLLCKSLLKQIPRS